MRFDVSRVREVVSVLLSEGFGDVVRQSALRDYASGSVFLSRAFPADVPVAVRNVFSRLGGAFLELGVFLSSRPDFVPTSCRDELRKIGASGSAIGYFYFLEELERSMSSGFSSAFKSLDYEPAVVSSLSQTHNASLSDGSRVSVTIFKPNAEMAFLRDLYVLRFLSNVLDEHPQGHLFLARRVFRAFEQYAGELLDLRSGIYGSVVEYPSLCSSRVRVSHPFSVILGPDSSEDGAVVPSQVGERLRAGLVRVDYSD